MKRKLIWLNILLAGLLVFAILQVRDEWRAGKQREDALQTQLHKPALTHSVPVPASPGAVSAGNYADIAQKMLFSKDRNPNVVVEAPAPPPPKPMPPLPLLRGVIGFESGSVALMSADAKSRSIGVKVGEKIGPFILAKLTEDEISFAWEDKTVTKSVSEMIRNVTDVPNSANTAAPVASASPAATAGNMSVTPPPGAQSGKPFTNVTGSAAGIKNCAPGDTTPAGTIADGYRKVVNNTPFGSACIWEPVK